MNSLMKTDEDKELLNSCSEDLRTALLECANHIQNSMVKGQEFEKIINRPFIIKFYDIKNLYQIILQRLENDKDKINYITFNLTVASSGDNFHTFNSFEDFESDIETRPIEVTNIQLSWQVLIKFPNSENYEKQVINIIITRPNYNVDGIEDDGNFFFVFKRKPIFGNGAIIISIETTNKIWSLDLINHIENWTNKNVKKPVIEEKYRNLYKKRYLIRRLIKNFIELFPYALMFYLGVNTIKNGLFHATSFNESIGILIILFSFLTTYRFISEKYSHFVADKIAKFLSSLMPRSFIILSETDEENYQAYCKQLSKNVGAATRTSISSIILNLISSGIFAYLVKVITKT